MNIRGTVKKEIKEVYRGEVYMIRLPEGEASEQSGYKPVVIIQNNTGNRHSTTTIVAVITSRTKHDIPTHLHIMLKVPSTIMCEQLFTVSKSRLLEKIGELNKLQLEGLKQCLNISLGLVSITRGRDI